MKSLRSCVYVILTYSSFRSGLEIDPFYLGSWIRMLTKGNRRSFDCWLSSPLKITAVLDGEQCLFIGSGSGAVCICF